MKEEKIVNYDNSFLIGRIKTIYGSVDKFAKAFGLTRNAVAMKLDNKSSWTRPQIEKACKLLGLTTPEDLSRAFFSHLD